jgi:hypothetical protein
VARIARNSTTWAAKKQEQTIFCQKLPDRGCETGGRKLANLLRQASPARVILYHSSGWHGALH